jgi:hypothetical protein
MKKNCAVIGCGKAFQILHMKNIQENYKIISVYDPRPNLLNAISKKLSIKKKFNNIESLLKKTQVKIFFCFLPRDISFSAIKKIIKKKNIILFLEKPPILFIENLLKIKSLINKNKIKIKIGYMLNYDKNVLRLKEIIKKENLINYFNGSFSINYNIRSNKYINTKENYITKNLPIEKKILFKKVSKKKLIAYKIFLNRYSHLINLIIFLISDLKFIKIKQYSLNNYKYTVKKNKLLFNLNLNNKKKYEINIKIIFPSKTCKLKIIYKNKKFFSKLSILTSNKNFVYIKNEDLYKTEVEKINIKKTSDTNLDQYKKVLNICNNSFINL